MHRKYFGALSSSPEHPIGKGVTCYPFQPRFAWILLFLVSSGDFAEIGAICYPYAEGFIYVNNNTKYSVLE